MQQDMLGILAMLQELEGEHAPLSVHSLCAGGRDHG